jgi:UDP-2,4-diacetamido-2,4,6-trideoxy-beta-L-altropyranose hydrolase
MNPLSKFYSQVEQFIKKNSVNFKLITFTKNIHELMVNHKIAIGAPGSSTWERAALGLPSLIIPIADNQLEIAKVIESSCSAIVVQRDCLKLDFKTSFLKLLNNIEIYRNNSFKLCDALGVYRVGYQILNLEGNGIFYRCRVADETDINLTYEWQILPQTRRYALNQNIPSYKSHCSWMVEKLKSNID